MPEALCSESPGLSSVRDRTVTEPHCPVLHPSAAALQGAQAQLRQPPRAGRFKPENGSYDEQSARNRGVAPLEPIRGGAFTATRLPGRE